MEVERPELILDKNIVLKNISMMKNKADKSGVIFRPHFKTHQSLEIGKWFRQSGVTKITVSSLKMAEYFAADNWNDITVAFPVNIREIDFINQLAKKIKLNLLVESIESVKFLSENLKADVSVYIKIDVGGNRTGIKADNINEIASLVRKIRNCKKLLPEGLLTHAGHTYQAKNKTEIKSIWNDSVVKLKAIKNSIDNNLLVSVGDTPACSVISNFSEVNEIRPGNFVFYDYMQYKLGVCGFEQIAAVLAVPVVAKHSDRNEIVVYGGAVHLSKDFIEERGRKIYGGVVKLFFESWSKPINNAFVKSLSQEHGIIKIPQSEFEQIKIGSLIGIVPVHSCLTVSLMKQYLTTDGEKIFTMNSH